MRTVKTASGKAGLGVAGVVVAGAIAYALYKSGTLNNLFGNSGVGDYGGLGASEEVGTNSGYVYTPTPDTQNYSVTQEQPQRTPEQINAPINYDDYESTKIRTERMPQVPDNFDIYNTNQEENPLFRKTNLTDPNRFIRGKKGTRAVYDRARQQTISPEEARRRDLNTGMSIDPRRVVDPNGYFNLPMRTAKSRSHSARRISHTTHKKGVKNYLPVNRSYSSSKTRSYNTNRQSVFRAPTKSVAPRKTGFSIKSIGRTYHKLESKSRALERKVKNKIRSFFHL